MKLVSSMEAQQPLQTLMSSIHSLISTVSWLVERRSNPSLSRSSTLLLGSKALLGCDFSVAFGPRKKYSHYLSDMFF